MTSSAPVRPARPGLAIRTPDQRLRVFVSSTLKELAGERRAARAAIERLRLAPVLFELGSRPHAPRDLYRAYLDQSDVFVGIYRVSYGWVAPGEEVSGLEDEYDHASATMPKLIYVVETAEARDPRLIALLDRIREDGSASYTYVASPEELGRRLEGDLATLLAERFDQSRRLRETVETERATSARLPLPLTPLVGRERDVAGVADLLRMPGVRLVTLIGPGGIGKTRLALEVARRTTEDWPGGVAFADLSAVRDGGLLLGAIARAVGVRDTGDGPLADKLALALGERATLVVVDNVEQVAGAAPVLRELLAAIPGLALLATSRVLLRVTGEHAVEVGPLPMPVVDRDGGVDEAGRNPAVQLFVERARAVKPDFELTPANAEAIARICVALDGVPLALELAAAHARLLPPAAMLARLDRRLPLLAEGLSDLPERQRTMRDTIAWSEGLLGDEARAVLPVLGVFAGEFSLDAAEFVARVTTEVSDVLGPLGALVDSSLVMQRDRGGDPTFSMLATVREYGLERLAAAGRLDDARAAHARFYVQLATRATAALEGASQLEWLARLAAEAEDVGAAIRHLLDAGEWNAAARFAWSLYVYWWAGGQLGRVRGWMEEVLASGGGLDELTRAIALYFSRAIALWQHPSDDTIPALTESAELFRREGETPGEALALISLGLAELATPSPDADRADACFERSLRLFREVDDAWGEAMALVTLGRLALARGRTRLALARFDESLACARRQGDRLGSAIALYHRGWAALALGDVDAARAAFDENLRISSALGHDDGVAYGLEGLVAIAAVTGDAERAGTLLGAATRLRERTGLYTAPASAFHLPYVERLRAGGADDDLERARIAGRALPIEEAVSRALGRP